MGPRRLGPKAVVPACVLRSLQLLGPMCSFWAPWAPFGPHGLGPMGPWTHGPMGPWSMVPSTKYQVEGVTGIQIPKAVFFLKAVLFLGGFLALGRLGGFERTAKLPMAV